MHHHYSVTEFCIYLCISLYWQTMFICFLVTIYFNWWKIAVQCVGFWRRQWHHSSTLPWRIPWTEEPGGLQSMGSLRVGHDWATSLWLFTFMRWRRKWQPTPVFLPGESRDGRAWWAAVCGVIQSWTRLKWLSSSSVGFCYTVTWICLIIYTYPLLLEPASLPLVPLL